MCSVQVKDNGGHRFDGLINKKCWMMFLFHQKGGLNLFHKTFVGHFFRCDVFGVVCALYVFSTAPKAPTKL